MQTQVKDMMPEENSNTYTNLQRIPLGHVFLQLQEPGFYQVCGTSDSAAFYTRHNN